ncbi:MAG: TMEM43 family protein [Kiritimatiellaeota bacterium]|nr:TMEM43 family protein [Kiritimatiellota bacterium]
MAYTETTTTSYGKRVSNSIKGIAGGFIAFIAGTILLFWNEGNFVSRRATIGEAERQCVSVDSVSKIDKDLHGTVIHATAKADTTNVLVDAEFGVSAVAIKLSREVEYYQWEQFKSEKKKDNLGGSQTTETTYTYKKEWAGKPIDSSEFKEAGHQNTVLMRFDGQIEFAEDVTFGAYRLPSFLVKKISGDKPAEANPTEAQIQKWNTQLGRTSADPAPATAVAPEATPVTAATEPVAADPTLEAMAIDPAPLATATDTPAAPAPVAVAATAAPSSMVHVEGNVVYFGKNPNNPEIGDVRVTLTKALPTEVSIIAEVKNATFVEFVSKSNGRVSALAMGDKSMGEMFADLYLANSVWTWILRVVGMLLVIGGLNGIFGILTTLLKVLPFLSDIVGVGIGLVCGIVGFAWSILVIAIAWLTYRPLIGVPLLAVSIAGIWYLKKIAKAKKAASATVPTAEPPPAAQ